MIRAIQIFTAVQLTIIGVSHITAPLAWAQFFMRLREQGRAGVFVVAGMSLGFGAPIVAFHEVWSGLPLVVTLLGWAQILKASLYFIFPGFGLKRLAPISEERSWIFIPAGVMLLALAVPIWWILIGSGWPTPA